MFTPILPYKITLTDGTTHNPVMTLEYEENNLLCHLHIVAVDGKYLCASPTEEGWSILESQEILDRASKQRTKEIENAIGDSIMSDYRDLPSGYVPIKGTKAIIHESELKSLREKYGESWWWSHLRPSSFKNLLPNAIKAREEYPLTKDDCLPPEIGVEYEVKDGNVGDQTIYSTSNSSPIILNPSDNTLLSKSQKDDKSDLESLEQSYMGTFFPSSPQEITTEDLEASKQESHTPHLPTSIDMIVESDLNWKDLMHRGYVFCLNKHLLSNLVEDMKQHYYLIKKTK